MSRNVRKGPFCAHRSGNSFLNPVLYFENHTEDIKERAGCKNALFDCMPGPYCIFKTSLTNTHHNSHEPCIFTHNPHHLHSRNTDISTNPQTARHRHRQTDGTRAPRKKHPNRRTFRQTNKQKNSMARSIVQRERHRAEQKDRIQTDRQS